MAVPFVFNAIHTFSLPLGMSSENADLWDRKQIECVIHLVDSNSKFPPKCPHPQPPFSRPQGFIFTYSTSTPLKLVNHLLWSRPLAFWVGFPVLCLFACLPSLVKKVAHFRTPNTEPRAWHPAGVRLPFLKEMEKQTQRGEKAQKVL